MEHQENVNAKAQRYQSSYLDAFYGELKGTSNDVQKGFIVPLKKKKKTKDTLKPRRHVRLSKIRDHRKT